ncbi:MAG TPA: methylated-DNA--[protein]-cysteine S-methyltransferase [Acidimicrobiales bacterium]|jgi:methylated-DNA-[protein]-cysteine S-methyltransferase|nr:methylated-DNA--[protein]-cysteine S-methyltransferase [Acidimicrobiales bacterium]
MNADTTTDQVVADLIAFTDPSPRTVERLHRQLEESAERAQILDVAYTTIDTPVGTLLLAATEMGLLRVAFEIEGFDGVVNDLSRRVSPRVLKSPKRLDPAAFEIDEYFSRRRTAFDLTLDYTLSNGFRLVVQQYLSSIAYGTTESYKQVAALVGNPKAVRAVGTACATNPLPIVVPCHRVLRTNGQLGGYLGGLEVKAALLRMESAA